jgi:hypothetical protein
MELQISDIFVKVEKIRTTEEPKTRNVFNKSSSNKMVTTKFRHLIRITLIRENHPNFNYDFEYVKYYPEFELDEGLFSNILEQITEAYRIKTGVYSSFEEFCQKEEYIPSRNNKLDYKDAVILGDKLNSILYDEWIDDVKVWLKMTKEN